MNPHRENLAGFYQRRLVGGRIKTSHFFLFKPGGDILARSDFALGLIHRKASERSGFEVVLFGCSFLAFDP